MEYQITFLFGVMNFPKNFLDAITLNFWTILIGSDSVTNETPMVLELYIIQKSQQQCIYSKILHFHILGFHVKKVFSFIFAPISITISTSVHEKSIQKRYCHKGQEQKQYLEKGSGIKTNGCQTFLTQTTSLDGQGRLG